MYCSKATAKPGLNASVKVHRATHSNNTSGTANSWTWSITFPSCSFLALSQFIVPSNTYRKLLPKVPNTTAILFRGSASPLQKATTPKSTCSPLGTWKATSLLSLLNISLLCYSFRVTSSTCRKCTTHTQNAFPTGLTTILFKHAWACSSICFPFLLWLFLLHIKVLETNFSHKMYGSQKS